MASNNNTNIKEIKIDEDYGVITPLNLSDEKDDLLEIQCLLRESDCEEYRSSSSSSPQLATHKTVTTMALSRRRNFLVFSLMGTLSMLLGYILLQRNASKNEENSHDISKTNEQPMHDITSPLVTPIAAESETATTMATHTMDYTCPANVGIAINDKDGVFDYYKDDTAQHARQANNSEFEGFLDEQYGAWGITPNMHKALNANWIHWYGDHLLHSESKTIYESACGTGLTLFVIIQLLYEQYNITGIEAFGNEYIAENVVTANQFYDWAIGQYPELDVRKGRICRGDSTNLTSFVPTNSFDIVMTGYIDPIVDPLGLGLIENWQHEPWCNSKNESKQSLMKEEQKEINAWFALWASQMIALVKPGGIVIIESISQPRCDVGDWGGVTKEWWAQAIQEYEWDTQLGIDPTSLEIIDFDPLTQNEYIHDRYNVKLTKRKLIP